MQYNNNNNNNNLSSGSVHIYGVYRPVNTEVIYSCGNFDIQRTVHRDIFV